MTRLRGHLTLERVALVVAIAASLIGPLWAAGGDSARQADDHALLIEIRRDVKDVGERVAKIEGKLEGNER